MFTGSIDSGRRTVVASVLRLPPSARYGFAIAVTSLAAWIQYLLSDEWAAELPFITFYPAVMSAAWVGGLWPGLVATLLSVAAAGAPPMSSFALGTVTDAAALVVFAISGTIISLMNEAWRNAAVSLAQAEQREQRARREAEHANRAKDDFLAAVSHELRTPLAATLAWAQTLASGKLPPDETRDAAKAIAQNANAESRLIESLLNGSKVIAGTFELERRRVDLSSAVRAAVEAISSIASAHVLAVDISDEPIVIQGDGIRLQQIVWNLLANAIKFTPHDGRIAIQLKRVGTAAQIQVTDTGQGIPAEFLPYVFERFTQVDSTTAPIRRGLGLGLALVREFTEGHGGTVSAASHGIGRGSTFTVTLPIQMEGDTQPRLEQEVSV